MSSTVKCDVAFSAKVSSNSHLLQSLRLGAKQGRLACNAARVVVDALHEAHKLGEVQHAVEGSLRSQNLATEPRRYEQVVSQTCGG